MFDYCVVGGGIVGIATAWSLKQSQPDASILILEKANELASHQTGHNSGVIHAGIYYEPGSLKADYCRRGAVATREFAEEHGIPHKTVGKLLVATNDVERQRLGNLADRAKGHGILSRPIEADELFEMEPNISGLGALYVPETGIIDYGVVTRKMAEILRNSGVVIRTGEQVVAIQERVDCVVVSTDVDSFTAGKLVACAGLQADRVAEMCNVKTGLQIVPFRGEYFQLPESKNDIVKRLIYPVPDPDLPFLGVHLSPMIDGSVTVGPNAVLGLAREKYKKFSIDIRDVARMGLFPGLWRVASNNLSTGLKEIWNSTVKSGYLRDCQKYCPSLTLADLKPREAGIRAQAVQRDGTLVHDFIIEHTDRTVHVLNAPSPAATSAFPIGEAIAKSLLERA